MVTERTATIELKGFEKLGQFLGGAKQGFVTTSKGEQAEGGAMSRGGGTGAVISKALLGKEGFAGLQKQMGSMATRMIPLSGAMAKGGAIGAMGAGVGMIVGMVSKAFGSSGIFTGVAGSFWKIAGVMIDMMLMPMLPYLMKFLQFMLTTILPLFQEAGKAIAAVFEGNLGPWYKLLWKVSKMILLELPWAITKALSKGLFLIIVNAIKSILPSWLGGGDKKGGGGGVVGGRGQQMMAGYAEGGVMGAGAAVARSFMDTEKKSGEVAKKMNSYADKNKHQVNVAGDKFLKNMIFGSYLPDTFGSVTGFFEDIGTKSGGIKDSIFGWISKIDWNPFDNIGSFISGAITKIWGSIKGFVTGSDADGKEVSPSIPGKVGDLKDKIGEIFPALGDLLATIKKSISTKFGNIWGGIKTFVTETIPDNIPKWEDIWSGLASIGGKVGDLVMLAAGKLGGKVADIWGSWSGSTVAGDQGEPSTVLPPSGIAGIIPNLIAKIPSWGAIWGGIEEKGSSLKNAAVGLASKWAKNLWGSWGDKTGIAGLLPKLWDNIKDLGSDLMGGMGDLFSVNVGEMTGMMLSNAQAKFGDIFKATGTLGKATGYDPVLGDVFQQGSMTYEANIFDIMKGFGSMVKDKFMTPINWAKDQWDKLQNLTWDDLIPDINIDGIKEMFKNIANKLIGGFNSVVNGIITKWNDAISTQVWGVGLPWGLGDKLQIPEGTFNIKEFAVGGRVPGGPGNRVPAILHGGEYVVPSHLVKNVAAGGGGGGTVTSHNQSFNITINSSYSPGDILRSIAQAGAIDETAYLNTVA